MLSDAGQDLSLLSEAAQLSTTSIGGLPGVTAAALLELGQLRH
jgi:hypothetical protein